jgi:hypothetical protein
MHAGKAGHRPSSVALPASASAGQRSIVLHSWLPPSMSLKAMNTVYVKKLFRTCLVEVHGFVIGFGEVPCDGAVEFEIERLDV